MTPYLLKLSLISKAYELSQELALEADGVEDHVFFFLWSAYPVPGFLSFD